MTNVSSVTKHFPSAEEGFTTTLSSTISAGATTVGVNSLSGYTTGEVATFIVAPTVASEKQVFTGVVDTAGLQLTNVVWTTGTNQTHAAGTTVVDYATATHISQMSKGILAEHNQDGTHSNTLLNKLWPVGSVYISVSPTNPGTSMGFGTWVAFATGRTLVGIDTGQTEFDTVEETGGAKTHTLTSAEMPTHSHGVNDPGHNHTIKKHANVNFTGTGFDLYGTYGGALDTSGISTTGISIQNAGSGGAHNNLQPYVVTYMWKRTA